MKRRTFLGLLAISAATWPVIALAQVPTKRPVIAVLFVGSQATTPVYRSAFTKGLREQGYVEGRDYDIEYRYADGDLTRLPLLADELVQLKPNVIVVGSSPAALATKQATSSIPVVAAATFDPISIGLAASQARPEGNVTGILGSWETLVGKQLELAFELVPRAKLVGMLVDVAVSGAPFLRKGAENAAQAMGAKLLPVEVRAPADIDAAFQALTRAHANIVIVPTDPMFLNERRRIAELAVAARLPIVCGFREHVEDGGLMSYGIDPRENWRRAATYVDKILKGARPADLPIEQPTKFELIVNLKTARALGLTIPESFLLRADEVIE
jgi:putative tryptophan/tyrosine transport system substrate-binding protein